MNITISKHEAASEQLDWAIRLLLDERAYSSATTLAGAAGAMLGERLKENSAHSILTISLAQKYNLDNKEVSDTINDFKNWLKHSDCRIKSDTFTEDIENIAIYTITTAIINFLTNNISLSHQAERFMKWTESRPEHPLQQINE
jgi:hypothetical protein